MKYYRINTSEISYDIPKTVKMQTLSENSVTDSDITRLNWNGKKDFEKGQRDVLCVQIFIAD